MSLKIIILALALICYATYGQERFIVVHDVKSHTADTIPFVEFDDTIERDKTDYYIGNYNNEVIELPQVPATEGVFKDSHFSMKKKASDIFDINDYPIRTSVQIGSYINGELIRGCSGSLIGKKYVLTAVHCVSPRNTNDVTADSMLICPIFDDGKLSEEFEPSFVSKVYIIKDWTLREDVAILELEKEIGLSTGWLSIGFDKVDSSFQDDIFFKFSYPTVSYPDDTVHYNGNDLFYSFGLCDFIGDGYYGALNAIGHKGESGSSYFKVRNNEEYTTYGALTFKGNLAHSRMNNEIFYTFKSILEDDFITDVADISTSSGYSIYPNPSSNTIRINSQQQFAQGLATLIDSQGRELNKISNFNSNDNIDISNLSTGLYYLRIENGNKTQILNFIKH